MFQVAVSVLLSVVLKFLAHPNFIFEDGLFFLAWFYYVPFLLVVHSLSLKKSAFFGFLYGFLSYFCVCFWLVRYSLFAALGVYLLFGFYWAVIFVLLAVVSKTRKYSFVFYCLIIFAAEFLFTKGYFGFGYGVSAYTQWKIPLFTRAVRYTKLWGLNFLIIFFNCVFSACLGFYLRYRRWNFVQTGGAVFFAALFIQHVFIGFFLEEEKSGKVLKTVLVQNNADPDKYGIAQYKKEVECLKRLTDEALAAYPETELVVWPETSVVVDVISAFIVSGRDGKETERSKMAASLFDYINSKNCTFLVGTSFKNYNSAVVFEPVKPLTGTDRTLLPYWQVYKKNRLVPFSEDFPFKKVFTEYYEKKVLSGRYWLAGENVKLLKAGDVSLGTPICFEDTFSELPRKMALTGASLFVSLSNDAWSASRACQMQHLAVSVFRSIENGIPMLRSANSGQTCFVDCYGAVKKMSEPFAENFLYCEVNLNRVK